VVAEGQILDGTYHLQRLVGEGGMGTVYEATHARLAGRYAIKVLLRELSDSADARARFDREARVTSLLQHPNVVQVIDHNSTSDGTSYLVMEFLCGESLSARLASVGRLGAAAVVDVIDQVAAGLAAAHAHGIVHRDLKPDNIFLVPVEGRATELVKILDFGISKVNWSRDLADGEICGTPQYMAPEQAQGRVTEVDATTDQFALAVIGYELLTGTNPFAGDTVGETLARVCSGIVPPSGLAGAVDEVLTRAMLSERALRFPSATAFAEAFRAAVMALEPPAIQVVTPEHTAPLAVSLRRARPAARGLRLGFTAAAIAITTFLGTGAAQWSPAAPVAKAPVAETVDSASVRRRLPEPVEPMLATAVTIPAPVEVRAPVTRRARVARKASIDRPLRTIAAVPAPARRPPPVLAPDEDATLPPSDL